MDTILDLFDEESKSKAFKACLARLQTSDRLHLEHLRACIKLRPSSRFQSDNSRSDLHAIEHGPESPVQKKNKPKAFDQAGEAYILTEELCDLLLTRIPEATLDSGHLYNLAEILCSDGHFASVLVGKVQSELVGLLPALRKSYEHDDDDTETEEAIRRCTRKATAYLMLLKCSYWLPNHCNHVIGPDTLQFLSRFIGLPSLDGVVYEAISAFLSLLKCEGPLAVAHPSDNLPPWLRIFPGTGQVVLARPIIDSSLWDRLSLLDSEYFTTGKLSMRTFQIWFQWISQAVLDQIEFECLYDSSYWDKIRSGVLYGHADQRKYCLAIIHQSMLAAQRDINTPTIKMRVTERGRYMKDYDLYAALFETIVLDRYANQVQACLPELTKLFESKITPLLASTLLSAALNPTIQEGVRRIVGNWYIDFVVKARGDIRGHLGFFLTGFLPWATMGELFTSTLVSMRDHTYASHGTVLVDVVARCVSDISDTPPPPIAASGTSDSTLLTPGPVSVLNGVLDFILEAQGKIFQFAILYLLEGLIKGLRAITNSVSLQGTLTPLEIDKIVRVSRLPGLPEITSDLCSEYCCQLCDLADPAEPDVDMIGYEQMRHQASVLRGSHQRINKCNIATPTVGDPPPLRTLRNQLEETNHRSIQGDSYPAVCEYVVDILDKTDHTVIDQADLYTILDALWEEADRRQFVRPVALHTPTVIFHPSCIRTCMLQQSNPVNEVTENNLLTLLAGAMDRLQGLAEGRSYILSTLGTTIRKAVFSCPEILSVLPFEDYFIRFFNSAPTIKPEFLFEVAAAQELQKHQPHRTYYAYYGQREWHAYAATIDLLRRFPQEQVSVAKHVLDRLLQPWRTQRAGIPIISKWKNVLQLQAMLLLVDFCIAEADADDYLAGFRQALILEPWPRYRFLLEWIIARIYYRFPGRSSSILNDLANVEKTSSTHIASLMKLAVLMAPHEMEEFSTTFMTHLVPFSASPKVQIRHESNYAIPIIFDLALARGWVSITENPTLTSLNKFIRKMDKFQTAPWTIRTLKLDAVQDYTIVNIFQGQYLTIESPERERVAYQDFLALQEADKATDLRVLPERISLGRPAHSDSIVELLSPDKANPGATGSKEQEMPAFFQTKAGFSIDSLHPPSGSPSTQSQRPASIVLVASLIDNPTNLGGLSRISESFGLEALYIDDLKKMAHKDFKATSVTSEKHLPIYELKVPKLPTFLLDMKRSGYQVVGIEQTDQSGVLGAEVGEATETRNLGTLPKRCVLVLGSEKGGITAEVLAVVDRCVEIRTVGVTRSLNVQTAGGIAMYEWWREWHGKG